MIRTITCYYSYILLFCFQVLIPAAAGHVPLQYTNIDWCRGQH